MLLSEELNWLSIFELDLIFYGLWLCLKILELWWFFFFSCCCCAEESKCAVNGLKQHADKIQVFDQYLLLLSQAGVLFRLIVSIRFVSFDYWFLCFILLMDLEEYLPVVWHATLLNVLLFEFLINGRSKGHVCDWDIATFNS